jgi:hypothetical protein
MAGVIDRRIKCVACQNPSMLDGWNAFEKMRGMATMAAIRELLIHDWEQRYATGKGMTAPGLGADDPKIASYVAQSIDMYPTFRNEIVLESTEHLLLWAPVNFIHRLAPTPLLMITGKHDTVHPIDDVLVAFWKAREPKRLELLPYDEVGLSIEPGLGESMMFAVEWFDDHLRIARPFRPSPSAEEAQAKRLRSDYKPG